MHLNAALTIFWHDSQYNEPELNYKKTVNIQNKTACHMYVQSDRNIPRIFRSQGPPNYDSNLHETSRVTDGLTSDNTLLWIFWVINYTVSLIIESLKLVKDLIPKFFFRAIFAHWMVIWIPLTMSNKNSKRKMGVL